MPKNISQPPRNIGELSASERHQLLLAIQTEEPINLMGYQELGCYLDQLLQEKTDGFKQQIMIHVDCHYTTFGIRKIEGEWFALILDPTNDFRFCRTFFLLDQRGINTICASGFSWDPAHAMQSDGYSCSLFAFDLSHQLENFPDDQFLALWDKQYFKHTVYWDELPPNFLWNLQSVKNLKQYIEIMEAKDPEALKTIQENGFSFETYTEFGLCCYPVDGVPTVRNESINLHVFPRVLALAQSGMKVMEAEEALKKEKEPFSYGERLRAIRAEIEETENQTTLSMK